MVATWINEINSMCFHCLTTCMCWIHVQNGINAVIIAAQYDIMATVISSRLFRKTIAVNGKSFYNILQLQLAHFSGTSPEEITARRFAYFALQQIGICQSNDWPIFSQMIQQLFCANGFSFYNQTFFGGCRESGGDAFIVACQNIRVIAMRNVIWIYAHRYCIVNVLNVKTA